MQPRSRMCRDQLVADQIREGNRGKIRKRMLRIHRDHGLHPEKRQDILLLDEPLSNLDAKLRHQVREEIKTLQQDLGITTIMVTATGLMLPALLLTFMSLAVPLVVLFVISLRPGYPITVDAFGAASYAEALLDPYYLRILGRTVLMALAITAVALFFAMPIAHFLARTSSRFKSILLLAIILPLFVGNAVRAIGWMVLLGERGVVNTLALELGSASPFALMYTWKAVLLGAAAVNLPYLVLTLQSVLEQINPSVEEASGSLGATPTQTWLLVTLPLMAPGLLAACSLSFILAMNAYAAPVLLGGPRFRMMGPAIAEEIIVQSDWSVGAALAFVLIVVTMALSVLLTRVVARSLVKS